MLYRLPDILKVDTVYLVEGEKDADRLWLLGIPATTNPQGAGKWQDTYGETLHHKKVVILPDNDAVGEQHAQTVARSLLGKASAVKIVRLPDLPAKGDVSDWLETGHSKEELATLVKATPILRVEDLQSPHEHKDASADDGSTNQTSTPILTRLVDVTAVSVQWLWRGYVPLGKVSILDGDPGLGKSLLSLDLAARVTAKCAMPDGTLGLDEARGVVLLTVEDDLGDTIRPRLEAAGADLSRMLTDSLTTLLVERKKQTLKHGWGDVPAWVVTSESGTRMDPDNFRKRVWPKLLAKAGLRQIRMHDLQHTFASLLIQQGESLVYVKEQMGHHSIRVTVDTYGHLVPGGNKAAVDKLDVSVLSASDATIRNPGATSVEAVELRNG